MMSSSSSSSSLSISLNDLDVIIECAQKHFWMPPLSVGEKLDLKRNLETYFDNLRAIHQAQKEAAREHEQQQQKREREEENRGVITIGSKSEQDTTESDIDDDDDDDSNDNDVAYEPPALTISTIAKLTPSERKSLFIELGFTGQQIVHLQRATQECAELLSFPKAVKNNSNNNGQHQQSACKLRFVNVTNPMLPAQTRTAAVQQVVHDSQHQQQSTSSKSAAASNNNSPSSSAAQQLYYQSPNAVASSIAWNATDWTPSLSYGPLVLGANPSIDTLMRDHYRDLYNNNRVEFQMIRNRIKEELLVQQQETEKQQQQQQGSGNNNGKNINIKNSSSNHPSSSSSSSMIIQTSGIRNQGATCYLNSLLQVLYHLPKLRHVVFSLLRTASSSSNQNYHVNNDDDDEHNQNSENTTTATTTVRSSAMAISKALQKLFVSMEMYREKMVFENRTSDNNSNNNMSGSAKIPETRELTQSFGWTASQAFVQHDIHECATLMLERLEIAMNNNRNDSSSSNNKIDNNNNNGIETINEETNEISKLFKIQLKTYFRTTDIDYESSHINSALYLSLPVRNCPTIYHSLDTYFEEQLLDGSSKLCVERNGKKSYHPAKHGTLIEKAPPVILMFLMRSDFDPQTGEPVKVVSRNEYYEKLNMKRYMMNKNDKNDKNDENDENNNYSLQAVVVHHGTDAGFGHYYAYARMHVDKEVCEARDDLRRNLHRDPNSNVLNSTTTTRMNDQSNTSSSSSSSSSNTSSSEKKKRPDGHRRGRPRTWVKLNDETVSLASDFEVYGSNFGGTRRNYWGGLETVTTSAAMLVYVRDTDKEDVLFDPYNKTKNNTTDDREDASSMNNNNNNANSSSSLIPQSLRQQFEQEEREEEERKILEKEQKSRISVFGVNMNDDLFSLGNGEQVDKWIFGCPWDIFMNKEAKQRSNDKLKNLIVPSFVGSYNKQYVIGDEFQQTVEKKMLLANNNINNKNNVEKEQEETFVISYAPDAYQSVATYYQGPTKILTSSSASSSSSSSSSPSAVSTIGNGLVFLISQPKFLFSINSRKTAKENDDDEDNENDMRSSSFVTTFHRFYDPITETVLPLFGMVSRIDNDGDNDQQSSSLSPKDLLDQVVEFAKYKMEKYSSSSSSTSTQQQQQQQHLDVRSNDNSNNSNNKNNENNENSLYKLWKYIHSCLVDNLQRRNLYYNNHDTSNDNSNNKAPPIYMYREEQAGSVYSFPLDATKIISGTVYVWQPHPDMKVSSTSSTRDLDEEQPVLSPSLLPTKDSIKIAMAISSNNTKKQHQHLRSVSSATSLLSGSSIPQSPVVLLTNGDQQSTFPSTTSSSSSMTTTTTTISALSRFSTVDKYFSYQRNKCTIHLAHADFRKGFPVIATVEAAGNSTFDEFAEIARNAILYANKTKHLGLYEEPEEFEDNNDDDDENDKNEKKSAPSTKPTKRAYSYHLRIGKNSSHDGPECPPNGAISWLKKLGWTSLAFTLRANQKQGTLFFDLVRVYHNEDNDENENENNVKNATRSNTMKIYDKKQDQIDDMKDAPSLSISKRNNNIPANVVSHIHSLESRPILTFEFFDSISVRPFSRHHLVVEKTFGTFQTKHLLKWIRRTILRDYVENGTISLDFKNNNNDNDDGTRVEESFTSSTPSMLLSPKKREISLTQNLEKLIEMEQQNDHQTTTTASSSSSPSSSSISSLVDVWNGRVYAIFKSCPEPPTTTSSAKHGSSTNLPPLYYCDSIVKSLESNSDYRFEISSPLTTTTPPPTTMIVVHFSMSRQQNNGNNNNNNTSSSSSSFVPTLHGDPFFYDLEPGETLARFKTRVAERLSLSIERVDRWFIRLVGSGGFNPVQLAAPGSLLHQSAGAKQDTDGSEGSKKKTNNSSSSESNNNAANDQIPIEKLIQQAREKAMNNTNSSVNVRKNNFQVWVGLEHAPLPGTRAQAGRRGAEERAFSIA